MQKSKIFPQVFAATSASLILVATGFHMAWPTPSLVKLFAEDSEISITHSQGSWIASMALVGSIFGSLVGFFLIDSWGRKNTLLLMAAPLFTSCVLIALARSYWWLYLARFTAGFGNGAVISSIAIYTSEIAEDRIRGGLGILVSLMINVGFFIPLTVGLWVDMKILASIGAVIPIVCVLIFVWFPESPYYYTMKQNSYLAEKSLIRLRGTPNVIEELRKIESTVARNKKNEGTVLELFLVASNRKALRVMIGLLTCQQFSGFVAIFAYSIVIFHRVNSAISADVFAIILAVVKLVTTTIVVFLADKVGRRPLLLTSTFFCTFFLIGEAIYFHLESIKIDVSPFSWVALVAMIGYITSFMAGIGTIPMFMASEIFPCEVKAFALTGGAIYLAVIGVVVTKLYQIISDAFGIELVFYGFAACSAISIVFIYFVVPETKNRSFKEIQEEFEGLNEPR